MADRVIGTHWPSMPPSFIPLTLPDGDTDHSKPDIARADWRSVLHAPVPDFRLYVQYHLQNPPLLAEILRNLVQDNSVEKIAVIADPSVISGVELGLFPGGVLALIRDLRRAGLAGQAAFLLDRLAVAGYFELIFHSWENKPDPSRPRYPYGPYHFGLDAVGEPATQWNWNDLPK